MNFCLVELGSICLFFFGFNLLVVFIHVFYDFQIQYEYASKYLPVKNKHFKFFLTKITGLIHVEPAKPGSGRRQIFLRAMYKSNTADKPAGKAENNLKFVLESFFDGQNRTKLPQN